MNSIRNHDLGAVFIAKAVSLLPGPQLAGQGDKCVSTNTDTPLSWFLIHSSIKEQRLLGEMVDSRTRAGSMKDEPGPYRSARM